MIESRQKERMLLGAILVDGKLAKLLGGLCDDDFADPLNRQILGEMKRLYNQHKPIDPTLIAENVQGIDGMQLLQYATSLAKEGSTWHAEQYAKDLHALGTKRKLYKLFKSCAERLVDEDTQSLSQISASSNPL